MRITRLDSKLKTRILKLLDLDFLRSVLFTTAMDMLNQLLASQVDHSLVRKLKTYADPTLLVVDELGYLSLDQHNSNLLYQVISARHSFRRSTVITTNTAFSEWGNILHNTTIATAIADRLVENSEVFPLGGESFRRQSGNNGVVNLNSPAN